MNQCLSRIGLSSDLSEALDRVDHNTVLNNLSLYDLKSNSFKFYLSECKVYMQVY